MVVPLFSKKYPGACSFKVIIRNGWIVFEGLEGAAGNSEPAKDEAGGEFSRGLWATSEPSNRFPSDGGRRWKTRSLSVFHDRPPERQPRRFPQDRPKTFDSRTPKENVEISLSDSRHPTGLLTPILQIISIDYEDLSDMSGQLRYTPEIFPRACEGRVSALYRNRRSLCHRSPGDGLSC